MFSDLMTGLISLVVILTVCISVFLALREVTLWYFRLGQIADSIVYIAKHFRAIDAEAGRALGAPDTDNATVRRPLTPQEIDEERKLNLHGD